MELELLQSISLAVSKVRTVETVLKMIVDGLVEEAGFALISVFCSGLFRTLGAGLGRWCGRECQNA
jgi:hypothetical protein